MSKISKPPGPAIGAFLEIGRYGRVEMAPVTWRLAKCLSKDTFLLITDGVLMIKAFDAASPEAPTAGDNRWRDSTLRHWLNSGAPAGKVDFGPHPAPDKSHLFQKTMVLALRKAIGAPAAPIPNEAYNQEPGFLRSFAENELACLVPKEFETEVCAGYDNKRKTGKDRTADRVFILSWEEYAKLPADLKGGRRAPQLLKDRPDKVLDKTAHWSRSPIPGLGAAVFELPFKEKRRANSGAYCSWGVRPCIVIKPGGAFTGTGTKKNPFRLG